MNMKWETIEMMGYPYYCEKGYRILTCLVRSPEYDFVIEKGGVFQRVNVKRAGIKYKRLSNSWSISVPGNRRWREKTDEGGVDIYLVYLPHQERFIEIPGDFFHGTKSKAKRIPNYLLNNVETFGSPVMKECTRCKKLKDSVERRQTNTAYVEEELNWVTECAECFEQTQEFWNYMWENHGYGS